MSGQGRVRRALISVSDKLGIADLAKSLSEAGVEIYSTGGTRLYLLSQGLQVRNLADYIGSPEMFGGRVKTLHPRVFGGILARPDQPQDADQLIEHAIATFELVVVNLYPFEATIARPGVRPDEAIEQIDVGGPSMVRAAAKNHQYVTVVTRPEQYRLVAEQITERGYTDLSTRQRLAVEAFELTASYDQAIVSYLRRSNEQVGFPATLQLGLQRKSVLRYGENPHQRAGLYRLGGTQGAGIVNARQLHGKELSYNNLLDLDSALEIVRGFSQPAASIIKHNNPCGAASSLKLSLAVGKALDGDPQSAFGGILGVNRTLDVATAERLCEPGLFIEAIVAPDFEAAAVGLLTTRPKWRDNVRLMQVGRLDQSAGAMAFRYISGGFLVQEPDLLPASPLEWHTVTDAHVPDPLWEDIAFGWDMVRHVKSNAILLARDTAVVGVGAGQMSRVDAVRIAIDKAGDRAVGSVLASDAFFPFPDSVELAAEAGVLALIQPGGSRRDAEVIAACNQHQLPMIFTGRRHFKH